MGGGDGQDESPACSLFPDVAVDALFVFGCPTQEACRKPWYEALEATVGRAQALAFRGLNYDDKWRQLNRWLDGLDCTMSDEQLEGLLLETVDLVARLAARHPTWG